MPLSDTGRAQARALSDALALVPFTRAYASDLSRALETAHAIARPHGLVVASDPRLREFDFGAWEGLTWAQILERWPELAEQPYTDARLYHPHEGEAFGDVVARAGAFLHDLRGLPEDRLLVVTHAGVLHAIVEALGPALRGRPAHPIVFATASITRVAMEAGGPRLITLNDVDHLHPAA